MAWKNYPPYMAKGNKSKYGAKKTVVNGIEFDSKKEAKRYTELHLLETAGAISDLQMQVKFVLIPAQREPDSVGPKGGIKKGKVIEREVDYIADFVYKDSSGETVVEDTKGFRTTDYILKRKMMLFFHGIRIVEI
ncbi:MAG: DUF1064 domain-containing protein [Mogibacterium sp.]|nr:DUF1064 domain-containing protein [Mogibacterium sp.]